MTELHIKDPIGEIVARLDSAIAKCRAAADLAEETERSGKLSPKDRAALVLLLSSSRLMKMTSEQVAEYVATMKLARSEEESGANGSKERTDH